MNTTQFTMAIFFPAFFGFVPTVSATLCYCYDVNRPSDYHSAKTKLSQWSESRVAVDADSTRQNGFFLSALLTGNYYSYKNSFITPYVVAGKKTARQPGQNIVQVPNTRDHSPIINNNIATVKGAAGSFLIVEADDDSGSTKPSAFPGKLALRKSGQNSFQAPYDNLENSYVEDNDRPASDDSEEIFSNSPSPDSRLTISVFDTYEATPNGEVEGEGEAMAAPVPEPATMLLLGFGLTAIAGVCRKKKA